MNRIQNRNNYLRCFISRSIRQGSNLTKYARPKSHSPTQSEILNYVDEISRLDNIRRVFRVKFKFFRNQKKITTEKERSFRRIVYITSILFGALLFLNFIWYHESIGGFFAKIRRAYSLSLKSEDSFVSCLRKVFETDFCNILLRKGVNQIKMLT